MIVTSEPSLVISDILWQVLPHSGLKRTFMRPKLKKKSVFSYETMLVVFHDIENP